VNRDTQIAWHASRLGEAVDALVERSRLSAKGAEIRNPGPRVANDSAAIGRWVEACAASAGLEAEPANVHYSELEEYLGSAGPALIRISLDGEPQCVLPARMHELV
jgi:hypothetical protein